MKYVLAVLVSLNLTGPVLAQDGQGHDHNHEHDYKVEFASMEEGWATLEMVAAEIDAAVKAENLGALHDLTGQLGAVAEGLKRFNNDVPKSNEMRYTSSLNQIRSLSDRLHAVHDENDMAAAQRMVPQLNGMVQLLMASTESP